MRKEEAEIRNTGDSLVYQTEKFLAENGEKLNEGEAAAKKAETEAALVELKTALGGANFEMIKSATEKVSALSQALGSALYAANAATSQPSNEQSSQSGDEGVEDAEIVEE
jgi:molecular chaperone DnaK